MLKSLYINHSKIIDKSEYPFNVPIIENLKNIDFNSNVTFFVGENGSGKSTLLESVAILCGFGKEGGSRNSNFQTTKNSNSVLPLAEVINLVWDYRKYTNGFFFRAESFFSYANYLDQVARDSGQYHQTYASYGGKSLHNQSHGESFLSLFKYRYNKQGIYLLDEPEAALSPQRQLSLLILINEYCKTHESQFIIATHSPILLAYPNADIYSFDKSEITKIKYEETESYQITKNFLQSPQSYLNRLF